MDEAYPLNEGGYDPLFLWHLAGATVFCFAPYALTQVGYGSYSGTNGWGLGYGSYSGTNGWELGYGDLDGSAYGGSAVYTYDEQSMYFHVLQKEIP